MRPEAAKLPSSTTHFYPPQEATIREHLALAALEFKPSEQVSGLSEALGTLLPLFSDDRQRCNWRVFQLYARLVCLDESNPEKAYAAVLTDAWKRPVAQVPNQLLFLKSLVDFQKWYAKSLSAKWGKLLKKRVEAAKSMWSQSSSGQDTGQPERVRSNRPRLLQPVSAVRKAKLSRRRKKRAALRANTMGKRFVTVWSRLQRAFAEDEGQTGVNEAELQPQKIRNHRTRNKKRFHCTVSRLNIPSIPSPNKRRSFLRIRPTGYPSSMQTLPLKLE